MTEKEEITSTYSFNILTSSGILQRSRGVSPFLFLTRRFAPRLASRQRVDWPSHSLSSSGIVPTMCILGVCTRWAGVLPSLSWMLTFRLDLPATSQWWCSHRTVRRSAGPCDCVHPPHLYPPLPEIHTHTKMHIHTHIDPHRCSHICCHVTSNCFNSVISKILSAIQASIVSLHVCFACTVEHVKLEFSGGNDGRLSLLKFRVSS